MSTESTSQIPYNFCNGAFLCDAFSRDSFSLEAFLHDTFSLDAFQLDAFLSNALQLDAFFSVMPVFVMPIWVIVRKNSQNLLSVDCRC